VGITDAMSSAAIDQLNSVKTRGLANTRRNAEPKAAHTLTEGRLTRPNAIASITALMRGSACR